MSRADEIAQGLREPSGCLTFVLVAEEYGQGHADFRAGTPPPKFSTPSYDLGRARAARLADEDAAFKERLRAEALAGRIRLRAILAEAGRPDLIVEYDAKMAELDAAHNAHPTDAKP